MTKEQLDFIMSYTNYLNCLFDIISKTHPQYPEYGYGWDADKQKIVTVKRENYETGNG